MDKFTPGKWVKRKMVGVGLPGQVGYAIDYNEDQEQVVDYVYEESDADLICAAKDLLEALEDAVADYDAWMKDADVTPNESLQAWTDKARAAISRARGEE